MHDVYFISFINFDSKHQRSNLFGHFSLALLKGQKTDNKLVDNLELIDCYGYYSHRLPEQANLSTWDLLLKKLLNINFRIHGSYAELKREQLINLDLGYGITGGPLIEINASEKARIEKQIQANLEREQHFFAEADSEAKRIVEAAGEMSDKQKAHLFLDQQLALREKLYEEALQQMASLLTSEDVLVETTQLSADQRSLREKLRQQHGIELFEFSFNPQGRTCKTIMLELLMTCLDDDWSGQQRKTHLKSLVNGAYFSLPIPRLTPGLSKMIYNSVQDHYFAADDSMPLPNRQWTDAHCALMFYEKNTYVDLKGQERPLLPIANKAIFVQLIENVVLLKRLLNDFNGRSQGFATDLVAIDEAIKIMRLASHDTNKFITIYHSLLQRLKSNEVFAKINHDILKVDPAWQGDLAKQIREKHIQLETGVFHELHRLPIIYRHANTTLALLQNDLSNKSSSIFNFFGKRPPIQGQASELHQAVVAPRF